MDGSRPVRLSALRPVIPAPVSAPATSRPRAYPSGEFTVTVLEQGPDRGYARAVPVTLPGDCPRCRGQGLVEVEGRWGRCRTCCRPLDQARAFNAARIPARYGACDLRAWAPQPVQRAPWQASILPWIEEIEDNRRPTLTAMPGLLLYGPPGRGKTHLAVGIVRRLLLDGRRIGKPLSARYVEPNQLLQAMKSRMGGERGGEAPLAMSALVDVDVLLIDDLIAPRTEFETSVIDELITRRWQRGGPTLITTNLSEDALSNLSPRVSSRLTDARWVPLSGADRRDHRGGA